MTSAPRLCAGWLPILALLPIAFAQKPVIDTAGVKNAASYAPVIAPQMLVSIFGHNFSNLTFTSTANPFPTQLNGTSVTFNGALAPILYLSPTQINVQVPSAVQGSLTADVVVTTVSGASNALTVTVSDGKAMGVFTQGSTGCGQVAAFNVHADGSIAVNTPQNSLDPLTDLGLSIFLTGIGPFADRKDGVPWQFNPSDQVAPPMAAILGIPNLSSFRTSLNITYAGPAPTLVGLDQVNGLLVRDRNGVAFPAPQGCKVPLFLTDATSSASQFVNVSIHNGGGACVDPPSDGLATVAWRKTFVSDVNGPVSTDSVAIQLLQGPSITFGQANSDNSFYTGSRPPEPAVCAVSYPATVDAGAITLSGPGLSPLTLTAQNQNGLTGYQATLPAGAIVAGAYQVSGAITATAQLPAPITVTTALQPGTKVSSALTVNWTGGDAQSMVTVQFLVRSATDTVSAFLSQQTVPASTGTAHFTGLLPGIFSPPQPYPTGSVEVIVIQEPISGPTQPFAIPGFTLGGRHTWAYTFDYRGLSN
ncbi:MAG TPA: IPT/TIG domain-containing protein [Bryobacteraceae bacterium]|nr:IPT/TIG domain-containing protein [Bryobacteraceae bacterium]